jgi:hypothetical protein
LKYVDKSNSSSLLTCPMCREKITTFTACDNVLIRNISVIC